jgi:hypothetical protein
MVSVRGDRARAPGRNSADLVTEWKESGSPAESWSRTSLESLEVGARVQEVRWRAVRKGGWV